MDIAIHTNLALSHQREHAEWFREGFKRHGIKALVTANINQEADIHIVSGPHYAKARWIDHPRVILLDRCYYKGDPEHVSLGWMRKDGGRTFTVGSGHAACQRKGAPDNERSIFLADYGGPLEQADTIRLHPASGAKQSPLLEVLRLHGVAIGYKTSALVTAGLEGLKVICKDNTNIMAEHNWLELLPYADWHHSEIASGEAIEHLCQRL